MTPIPSTRPPTTALSTLSLHDALPISARRSGVFLAELVDPARGVEDLLLARIERVAARADFHLQIVSQSRLRLERVDRKSTRLNSSHLVISYAVFCLKKKTTDNQVG